MLRFVFVSFAFLTWGTESAKILGVFPVPAYSHFQLGFRLMKELADRGHEVTVINPYPRKAPIHNYKDVSVEENVPFLDELKKDLFNVSNLNMVQNIKLLNEMGTNLTEITFSNRNVQNLLSSGGNFDLVIIEFFLNAAHVGFGDIFKAPVIVLFPAGSNSMVNYIVANPAPSSYVPNVLGSFTKHMNFFQRLQNLIVNAISDLMNELIYLPAQREVFRKYVKTGHQLDDVLYNVSLIFTNSHVSVSDAVPHVPNIIEIGGFHVSPPKELPPKLQKFLDESENGVVLFSMGSNLKSKDLKPEVRDAILRSFAKIKQNVLWKFEEDLPNLPPNVQIMKWLPQQDILAHPNIRAFISHGGQLSTIETVYHGVPIIGIPVFGDQKTNVAAAVANGYAVGIPLEELSEKELSRALDEVLNNPKYRECVKRRSKLMHDQPLKPLDAAVYWTEHVIRHKGAPHLRSAGIDLNWYERHLIDVIVFIVLVVIISCVVFYIFFKKILSLLVGRRTTEISKAKKNK